MEPIRTQLPFTGVMTSNIGGRKENQDSCGYSETPAGLLLVVCDGMGGGPGGKTASSIAASTIVAYVQKQGAAEADAAPVDSETLLHDAVVAANRALRAKIQESPELDGMGTTVTAVLLTPTGAVLAHVGDSRIYQLHHRKIAYRTADHSLVAEMVRAKQQTEEQARLASNSNIITRALGIKDEVKVDTVTLPYRRGDRFVLCTDGIWGAMPQPELVRTLTENPSPENTAEVLNLKVENAGQQFKGGRHDNYTLIIADARNDSAAPTKANADAVADTPGIHDNEESDTEGGHKKRAKRLDSRILALIITGIIITPLIAYLIINKPDINPAGTPAGTDTTKVEADTTTAVIGTTSPGGSVVEEDTTPVPPTESKAEPVKKGSDSDKPAAGQTPTADTTDNDDTTAETATVNSDSINAVKDKLVSIRQTLESVQTNLNKINEKHQNVNGGNLPDKAKEDVGKILKAMKEKLDGIKDDVREKLDNEAYKLLFADSKVQDLNGEQANSFYITISGLSLTNHRNFEANYAIVKNQLEAVLAKIDDKTAEIDRQLEQLNE